MVVLHEIWLKMGQIGLKMDQKWLKVYGKRLKIVFWAKNIIFCRKSVCVNGGYLPFLAEIIIQYLTTSLVLLGDDIGRSATTMKSGIWW